VNNTLKLLTLLELARELSLPWRWLRDEALAGRIPCLQIGRCLRFEVGAVERALAARAAEGVTSAR
jgi:hypothetical protein